MKAGLYLRVSTSDQTTQNQRVELEAYCRRQGWEVAGTYDDSGVSGAKAERPALNRMLADAASKKLDVIVCWKIDRLGRSTVHLLGLLERLQALGVGFVSTTQAIDTTTAYGRMVLTFLSAIAEFERDLIKERVRAGMRRAREEGVRVGRPRTAIDIRRALELRRAGLGFKQVARQIGVPRSTLFRTLQAIPKPSAA